MLVENNKWVFVIAAVAAAALLGCASEKSSVPSVECTDNRDCPGGSCVAGKCVKDSCRADSDCPEARICNEKTGHCLPDEEGSCLTDADCDKEFICDAEEGKCKESGTQPGEKCTSEAECSSGHCLVEKQKCVECLNGDHCANVAGRPICRTKDNVCVQCIEKEDCAGGFLCVPQSGACVVGCDADADCEQSGKSKCRPTDKICVECFSKDDCGTGKLCSEAGTCEPGCATPDDCTADLPKCMTSTGKCVQCLTLTDCTMGVCDYGGSCRLCGRDFECEQGTVCNPEAGKCVALCRTDVDCINTGRPSHCRTDGQAGSLDGCVACLSNDHCQQDQYCDGAENFCKPKRGLCESCTTATDCVQENALCVPVFMEDGRNVTIVSQYCGSPCSSSEECPPGYMCNNVLDPYSGTSMGVNCVPSGMLCEYFDTMGEPCDGETGDPCPHASPNECHDFLLDVEGPYCTVGCGAEHDCPEGFYCEVVGLCKKR